MHYDSYNKRFGSDGMHESLDWAEFESEIQEFKDKVLIPHIVKTEKAEKTYPLFFICLTLFINYHLSSIFSSFVLKFSPK